MTDVSKFAFVTGAGSGIGRAVALALAEAGYDVALFGRRLDKLEETAAAMSPGLGHAIAGDVGDAGQVAAAFAEVESRFGRLDLLFNNAGIGAPAVDIDELAVADWMNVVQVNLTGAFLCAREAFSLMRRQRAQGGRIINNGSISAHAPRPRSVAYTATKHAITGLTRSLSLDGRPYDIACGQIDIGNAATDMVSKMKTGVPQADGSIREEPLMAVEEVASAVVAMAGLPLSTNVQFMTIMATKMPFIGRG
jgi:NAD(P)-dependent dehydrogenase (short-subunit alcohol dehydrogenase family)